MHRIILACGAVGLLLSVACGNATEPLESRTIDVSPTIIATGEDAGPQDGEFDRFWDAPNVGMVANNGFGNNRTTMEYALSELPSIATVTSATLRLPLLIFEGTRSIQVHAYAADGVAQLSDFSRNALIATYVVSGHQNFEVDVTAFVNERRTNNGGFVGFNVREEPPNSPNFTIMRVRDDPPPVLRIEFTTRR